MIALSASAMIVDAISGGRRHRAGTEEVSEAEVLQHQIAEAKIAAGVASAHQHGLIAWLVRHNPLSHRPAPEAETGHAINWSGPKSQTSPTWTH
jgi:hypothetical protein